MLLNADRTVTLQTRSCLCSNNVRPGYNFGLKACTKCLGTGRTKQGKGKGLCAACYGSRREVCTKTFVPCARCNSTCTVPETETDYCPKEWVTNLPMSVDRNPRTQSLLEAYIGVGLFSVTDYGRHKEMSDPELITQIRDGLGSTQLCKMIQSSNILHRFASHLIIRCNNNGYSVIPAWQ